MFSIQTDRIKQKENIPVNIKISYYCLAVKFSMAKKGPVQLEDVNHYINFVLGY